MQQGIVSALNSGALTIAHRGARSIAPENTIAAARKALAAGAHMWESDIRMTRDGELVLIHDVSLKRTSNVRMKFPERYPWYVHDFTLAELRSLDFGSWFAQTDPFGQVQAGAVSPNDLEQYRGEPAPTLEEAVLFTVGNQWLMNIEIKDLSGLPGHDSIVEKVVCLVRLLDAADGVIISSFNHNYLAQLRAIDPCIKTGALVNRAPHDVLKLMDDLGALTFHPRLPAVRPRQVLQLRQKGLSTLVWVVNSRKVVQLLYGMGADGFFTDFPQTFTNNWNEER
ncbi:MAG: glycerophosphodiester phosphodiesterase [Syntrophobacteraceae bacterium]